MMEEKLNSLVPAAIAFVLAAVIAVVGIYVVTSLPGSGGSLGTVTAYGNDSFNVTNVSVANTLTHSPIDTGSFAWTHSNGTTAAYNSLNETAGTFLSNVTTPALAYATYTYQTTTIQSNASVSTTTGLSTFVNMLPLLALGLAAAVVIALLAGYLGKKDSL